MRNPLDYMEVTFVNGVYQTFQAHLDAGGDRARYAGLDLVASIGTKCYAIKSGYMRCAVDPAGANYIMLSTEDGVYFYVHLDRFEGGDRYVNEGDIIGYTGNTGYTFGAHLHIGLLRNGVYVDPAPYLNLVNNITNMDTPEFVIDQDQNWGLSHIANVAHLYPNDENMWQNIANINPTWQAADGTIKSHNGTWQNMNEQLRVGDKVRTKGSAIILPPAVDTKKLDDLQNQISVLSAELKDKDETLTKKQEEYKTELAAKLSEQASIYQASLAQKDSDIMKAQSEKDAIQTQLKRITEVGVINGVDLSAFSTDIIDEVVDSKNLFQKYQTVIDKKFPDKYKKLREFLKFDVMIYIGANIVNYASGLITYLTMGKGIYIDPVILNAILTGATTIKQLITREYDSNGDGVLDISDTHVLKNYKKVEKDS
jgi:hypothetical protein